MFTIALIASLIGLAVPLSIFARMVITARSTKAEIHAHMSTYRRTHTDNIPTDTQGATSTPPRTAAAPCYPATCNDHEVHTS